MPPRRVLLVEDDPALAESLEYTLGAEGFEIVQAGDGDTAIRHALEQRFDLLLLDLNLPNTSGTEICRRIRAESAMPIIILSARDSEIDRVLGLESGADDYVTKPVSQIEILSHVRAILRRRQLDQAPVEKAMRRMGGLELDLLGHRTFVDGHEVPLTRSEFAILALLSERPGKAYERREIMQRLWHSGHSGETRACDTHIVNLRRKIEPDPRRPTRLQTVRGVGYRLSVSGNPDRTAT